MSRFFRVAAILTALLIATPFEVQAQRYRYMDSSGNIHFVDSLADVPRQYREQLVPPTPTPVLDARQRKELQRAKEREYKERLRQVENKKRELERVRKTMERQQKLRGGKVDSVPAPSQSTAPMAREDSIEVIR